MPLIQVQGVYYAYPLEGQKITVLDGLSFEIQKGEMLAIQGPSGSGKSTLLYLMGCLLKPDRGTVEIGGTEVTRLSNDVLAEIRNKRIGFVFQQFHLLPKTSVLQNILLPSFYPCEKTTHELKNTLSERARELAVFIGLGERLDHHSNQLSGGQQQRVAIARALMNDPEIILADEPTGNLDSKSATQIVDLLKRLNQAGKTIVIITHDSEIAKQCTRILHIRDGKILDPTQNLEGLGFNEPSASKASITSSRSVPFLKGLRRYFQTAPTLLPLVLQNIKRNRVRSFLTMIGITIGVSSVLAMVTLGQFTKRKILDSYADLGVRTLMFSGNQNWKMKATDLTPVVFQSFDWERDLLPLKKIFPQIQAMSPALNSWRASVTFGGKTIENDAKIAGVSEEALRITQKELLTGRNFSPYHVAKKSGVCLIGFEIAQRLFQGRSPLGQVLFVSQDNKAFPCRVLGVLKDRTSNNEWLKPNLQIIVPYTYFQIASGNFWDNQISDVLIQVKEGFDIEGTGRGIRAYFESKYGKSGRFRVDSDSLLITQMTKFLTLFTVMLGSIALVSLAVGGIGITNMMLVSVNERFKEIGLRKALGATDFSIRLQFLLEAMALCGIAGLLGVILGVGAYESVIFGASKLVSKLHFEWVLDPIAMGLSVVSILGVGVLSGITPAVRAEKLQVIEALRTE